MSAPLHDSELQAGLMNWERHPAKECARLRESLMVWRVWAICGWLLALALVLIWAATLERTQ